MALLSSIIADYSPPDSAVGVPLKSTVEIEFNCLVDEASVRKNFFIEGPDKDTVIGPDSQITPGTDGSLLGQTPDFLTSPGYKGLVEGECNFETLSGNHTSLTFTPTQPFAALTEYGVYLSDIYTPSFLSTVSGISNIGNGEVEILGTLTNITDTVNLRVTKAGVAGIAQFEWWRNGDPFTLHGPILSTRRNLVTLFPNLFVKFEDGSFSVDDTFTCEIVEPVLYSGILNFTFETGTGSIEILPSTTSTSVLNTLSDATLAGVPLEVVSMEPASRSAQVDPETKEITVTFNKPIDSNTVTDSCVDVVTRLASSHPALRTTALGKLAKNLEVSGNVLKIHI
jgi:hypothetical protein